MVDKFNATTSASELIQTDQFNEALDSIKDARSTKDGEKAYEGIVDKFQTLMQSGEEIDLYVMPGVNDFEFDSDQDALDMDDLDNFDSEDDANIDMEEFFGDFSNINTKN